MQMRVKQRTRPRLVVVTRSSVLCGRIILCMHYYALRVVFIFYVLVSEIKMNSWLWKSTCLAKTKAEKAKISFPTHGAFCVEMEAGIGMVHGGTVVGAKGLMHC